MKKNILAYKIPRPIATILVILLILTSIYQGYRITKMKNGMLGDITDNMNYLHYYAHNLNRETEADRGSVLKTEILSYTVANACKNYRFYFPNGFSTSEIQTLAHSYESLVQCIRNFGYVPELRELQAKLYPYLECFPYLSEDDDFSKGHSTAKLFDIRLKRLQEKIKENGSEFDDITSEAIDKINGKLREMGYDEIY